MIFKIMNVFYSPDMVLPSKLSHSQERNTKAFSDDFCDFSEICILMISTFPIMMEQKNLKKMILSCSQTAVDLIKND